MFFVTVFTKLEKGNYGWDFGSQRLISYFETLEDARNIVMNNIGDICETVYSYAVIEEIEPGRIYALCEEVEIYKVDKMTVISNGEEVYNNDLQYVKMELPEEFPKMVSMSMG